MKRAMGFPPSMFFEYVDGVDQVLRYETIHRDLQEVFTAAGMGEVEVPVVNRTEERDTRDYRSAYSRLTTFAVKVSFSGDLSRWGYEF